MFNLEDQTSALKWGFQELARFSGGFIVSRENKTSRNDVYFAEQPVKDFKQFLLADKPIDFHVGSSVFSLDELTRVYLLNSIAQEEKLSLFETAQKLERETKTFEERLLALVGVAWAEVKAYQSWQRSITNQDYSSVAFSVLKNRLVNTLISDHSSEVKAYLKSSKVIPHLGVNTPDVDWVTLDVSPQKQILVVADLVLADTGAKSISKLLSLTFLKTQVKKGPFNLYYFDTEDFPDVTMMVPEGLSLCFDYILDRDTALATFTALTEVHYRDLDSKRTTFGYDSLMIEEVLRKTKCSFDSLKY